MKSSSVIVSLLISSVAASALPKRTTLRPCTYAEIALATGIHLNIEGQYAEYNGTLLVEQVELEDPLNFLAFQNAKGRLQSDIQAGMNIRLFNQQIAPAGNPALAGLATYDTDEETEKSLADGLTGIYAEDKAALDSLKSDIMSGILLNQANERNATSLCDMTLVYPPEDEMGS